MVDQAIAELRELAVASREQLMRAIVDVDLFLQACDGLHSHQTKIATEPLWKALQKIHSEPSLRASAETVVAAVSLILRNSGAPLSRKVIHQRLEATGVKISAKNLGTILWRSEIIETIGRRYWFVGEDRPKESKIDANK